jgi:hypothetical protein
MSKDAEKVDTESAKKAILQERKERSDACRSEIQEVLNKHRCTIQPMLVMNPQGSQWMIDFPAQD